MKRVGVVGCGSMGSGIAEVCARADLDAVVAEADEAAVAAGRHGVEQSLGRMRETTRAFVDGAAVGLASPALVGADGLTTFA